MVIKLTLKWTIRLTLLYIIAFMVSDNRRQRDRATRQQRRAESYRHELHEIKEAQAKKVARHAKISEEAGRALDKRLSEMSPIEGMFRKAKLNEQMKRDFEQYQQENA